MPKPDKGKMTFVPLDANKSIRELAHEILDAFEALGVEVDREGDEISKHLPGQHDQSDHSPWKHRIRTFKSGRYDVPTEFLNQWRLPFGHRIGQEQHTQNLAAWMQEKGRVPKPVKVDVWDDYVHIWDGQHRVAVANRLGWETLPVQVTRRKGSFPVEFDSRLQRKIERVREQAQSERGSLKGVDIERRELNIGARAINEVLIAMGEHGSSRVPRGPAGKAVQKAMDLAGGLVVPTVEFAFKARRKKKDDDGDED